MTMLEKLGRVPHWTARMSGQPSRAEQPAMPQPRDLDEEIEEIARAYPNPVEEKTFRERALEFAEIADRQTDQLAETTASLRKALAENMRLRSREADLEKHIDVINEFWQGQWSKVNEMFQQLGREHFALTSRLDGAVEFMANTREAVRQAAVTAAAEEAVATAVAEPTSEEPAPADPKTDGHGTMVPEVVYKGPNYPGAEEQDDPNNGTLAHLAAPQLSLTRSEIVITTKEKPKGPPGHAFTNIGRRQL